jgi:Nif-specific regulatory protein
LARQGRQRLVTDSALRLLIQYDWPGNIRELENVLERAAVMAADVMINHEALTLTGLEERILSRGGDLVQPKVNYNDPELDERKRIISALESAGWVQAKAARLLGMTPRQIAYHIQQFNINMKKI